MAQNKQMPVVRTFYRSFLVRLWCDVSEGTWHASAQFVQSGKVTRFATLQALFSFLEDETNHDSIHDPEAPRAEDDAA